MKTIFKLFLISLYTVLISACPNPVCSGSISTLPPSLSPKPGTPSLTFPNLTKIAAGFVSLRVNASGIVNMGSFQFSVEFDPALMSYDTVTNWYPGITDVMIVEVSPGKLAFIWAASTQGITITNGSFFTIRFVWNGSSSTSPVNWSDDPTPREFGDYDGILFIPEYNNGSVTGIQPVPVDLELNNIIIEDGQTACYNATQTINVAGNGTFFTVDPGGAVTLIAGQTVRFLSGTSVISGAYLNGHITETGNYCDTKEPALVGKPLDALEKLTDIPLSEKLFHLYPNPTTGRFNLELFSRHDFEPVLIRVYGPLGEPLETKEMISGITKELSLEGRPRGMYFVSIMQNDLLETAKILLK